MNRSEMKDAIAALPGAHPPQGYYVDTDDDDHFDHGHTFCREHAVMVARVEGLTRAVDAHIAAAWSGDDSVQRCGFAGCDAELDTGGLTDYGVDTALALTEEDPFACSVTPAELNLSALAMADDDKRWPTWDRHARSLLERR